MNTFLTFYNPYPTGSPRSQEHWANYVNDATIAKYQVEAVGSFIGQASREQIQAIDDASRRVSGTLAVGFAAVTGGLQALAGGINKVYWEQVETNASLNRIDQRLSLQVEEQRIGNVLLENLAQLLRIPDSQKQRQHHIEMGLKFFKNARKDADLYPDALRELLAAEALQPGDYFVLHRLGMLYLYAPPVLDLPKAADYLAKAGKYAAVESDPEAVRLGFVLQKSIGARFTDQADPSAQDISLVAAESYHHAAAAQYALGNLAEAVKLIEKAATLEPKADTHRFFKAKYLAASGQAEPALAALKTLPVITDYVNAALSDLDLLKGPALGWADTFEAEKKRLLGEFKSVADALQEAMARDSTLVTLLAKNEEAQRILAFAKGEAKPVTKLGDYFNGAFLGDRSKLEKTLDVLDKIKTVADALQEAMAKDAALVSLLAENEAAQRILAFGKAEAKSAMELGDYFEGTFPGDRSKLEKMLFVVERAEARTVEVIEMVPTGEMETYIEEIVVRPASFFRRAVVEKVQRTRPVCREERRKKAVPGPRSFASVNAFGKLISILGNWVEIVPGTFQMGETGKSKNGGHGQDALGADDPSLVSAFNGGGSIQVQGWRPACGAGELVRRGAVL